MVGIHVETRDGGRAVLNEAESLDGLRVGNHSCSYVCNKYRVFDSDTGKLVADLIQAN